MAASALRRGEGQAGGKLILLGEHAVVHGEPALSTTLPGGVRVVVDPRMHGGRSIDGGRLTEDVRLASAVTAAARQLHIPDDAAFDVSIGGDLPVAVGLGSSAALAVALARALAAARGSGVTADEIVAAAHAVEGEFHGTSSGVDVTTILAGGLGWFEKGPPRHWEAVRPKVAFELVVAVVDRRHDTSRTVGSLRARSAAHPGVYRALFASIGALVREARAAIETGDLARLGEAMTCDHGLLRTCGVSTPTLDAAVDEALAAGALGAKLTGGGGGGAIVALAPLAAADLAERLRLPGRLPFVVRIEAG